MTWLDEERAHREEIREELRADLAELRRLICAVDRSVAEAKADLMKWSFVFWVGAVSAIAVLAGVLK